MAKNPYDFSLLTLDGSIRRDIREDNFKELFILVPSSRCSSSPQPSSDEFIDVIDEIKRLSPGIALDDIYVFDLRKERHLHIGNIPVVLTADDVDEEQHEDYSSGAEESVASVASDELMAAEGSLARQTKTKSTVTVSMQLKHSPSSSSLIGLHRVPSIELEAGRALSEQQILAVHGIGNYERVPVVDGGTPESMLVDLFIDRVLALDKKSWVHFHCHGGKGRSAIFMFMYDAIRRMQYPDLQDGNYSPRANRKLQLKTDGKTSKSQERRVEFVTLFAFYLTKIKADLDAKIIKNFAERQSWSEWRDQNSPRATRPRVLSMS